MPVLKGEKFRKGGKVQDSHINIKKTQIKTIKHKHT